MILNMLMMCCCLTACLVPKRCTAARGAVRADGARPREEFAGVGILFHPSKKQVIYSQRQHVLDIRKRFNMSVCNDYTTPQAGAHQ